MADIWMTYRHARSTVNLTRILVLTLAVVAGVGAAHFAAADRRPQIVQMIAPPPPSIRTAEVLVVRSTLHPGTVVKPEDLAWQLWPADGVTTAMISREAQPEALQAAAGARVRATVEAGEPLRADRLVRDQAGGPMAIMLRQGHRAIAINIDSRGGTTAGGFIMPNDRVDVIKVTRDEMASKVQGIEVLRSETLFKNIRVLAIGRNTREPDGRGDVSGSETATLELDPRQAEAVFLAQRTGQLTLALRGIDDIARVQEPEPDANVVQVRSGVVTRRFLCTGGACSDGR